MVTLVTIDPIYAMHLTIIIIIKAICKAQDRLRAKNVLRQQKQQYDNSIIQPNNHHPLSSDTGVMEPVQTQLRHFP